MMIKMGAEVEIWRPNSEPVKPTYRPKPEELNNPELIKAREEAAAKVARKARHQVRTDPESQVDPEVAKSTAYTREQIKAMPTGKLINIILARGQSLGYTKRREGYYAIIMRSNPGAVPKPLSILNKANWPKDKN
jgi:hypothetical protein